MKVFAGVIFAVFCMSTLQVQNNIKPKLKKIKVSGTVTQTSSYCGGARPSNEMLASLTEPKPFAHKKLFIKRGKTNDMSKAAVAEVTTDSLGNFSIALPMGDYCIVDEMKSSKKNYDDILAKYGKETQYYSAVDAACLKEWFSKPDAVFTVGKEQVKNISVSYHHPCSWNGIPCVQYHGPLPP